MRHNLIVSITHLPRVGPKKYQKIARMYDPTGLSTKCTLIKTSFKNARTGTKAKFRPFVDALSCPFCLGQPSLSRYPASQAISTQNYYNLADCLLLHINSNSIQASKKSWPFQTNYFYRHIFSPCSFT